MNQMQPSWVTWTEHRTSKRGTKKVTYLVHIPTMGQHTLNGKNGVEILSTTADQWNAEGKDSPMPTKCAGDLSPAARRNYLVRKYKS